MILPRVVIDVSRRPSGAGVVHPPGDAAPATGWTASVRLPDGTRQVIELDAGALGPARPGVHVPVVPDGRRPAAHAALCAGDAAAVNGLLDRIAARSTTDADVEAYGRWLFEALLAPAWPAVLASTEVKAAGGVELALRWPVDEADLHHLLWEAMHDGAGPLAAHPDLIVGFSRLVPVARERDHPRTISSEPRLLLVAGSGLSDETIRPGAMFMGLLRGLESEGVCTPLLVDNASLAEFADACGRFKPHLVHLVAHGDVDEGVPLLAMGPAREAVRADAVLTALRSGAHRPTAVVLSACHSGGTVSGPDLTAPLAVSLVDGGIPIAVGMAGEVSEPASRMYTKRLIAALHRGDPICTAAAEGRRAALTHGGSRRDRLDWAMPTLFLAEDVDPGFRLFDSAQVRGMVQLADALELRQRPLFIGRTGMMDLVDALVAPGDEDRVGFATIVRDGDITGLGSTRILREIGYRLLRRGHIPLLLGPYGPEDRPTTVRGFAVEIVTRMLDLVEHLGIPPPPLSVVDMDVDSGPAATATVMAARKALVAFRRRTDVLDPETVRTALREDLAALAAEVSGAGPPFGVHGVPVLLGDQAHRWDGLIDALPRLVGPYGLGTARAPIPVVLAASLTQDGGRALKAFTEYREGQPGYAFPPLNPLSAEEALVGFQWVLLHPWRKGRRDPVYAAAHGGSTDRIANTFALTRGMPSAVRELLYDCAELLHRDNVLVAHEDERAYEQYRMHLARPR